AAPCSDGGKGAGAFLPIEEILIGHVGAREGAALFVESDKAGRIAVRKRLEERRINETENGKGSAQAERGEEDGVGREAKILAKLAEREAKVLKRGFKAEGDYVAAAIVEMARVAELAIGGVTGGVHGSAIGLEFAGRFGAVEGHLFIEVAREFIATDP